MRLETESGRAIEDPSAQQLRTVLAGLRRATTDSLAVLVRSDDPDEFMQAAFWEPEGVVLDCCDAGRHLRFIAADMDAASIVMEAFLGGQAWRSMVQWQDVTDELVPRRANPVVASLIIALAVALAALVLYLSFR